MRRRAIALALAFGSVSLPSRAAAPTEVSVEYSAPSECPDKAAFVDQVRARTRLAKIADGASVHWTVTLRTESGRHKGELRVIDADGTESVRTIRAATCEEVVSAMALVAALSVDPDARTEPEPPPRPTARPTPGDRVEPPPPPEPRTRVHWSLGEHVQWATGVLPEHAASLRLFGGVAWRDTGASAEGGGRAGTGPSLRLSASRMSPAVVRTAEGRAELSWWAFRIEVAPIAWVPFGSVSVAPSAGIEAGALHAQGLDVDVKRATTRPWIALALGARVELPIYGAFRVEAQATAFAPLVRDRFWIGQGTTVFRPPAVGAFGAVGVAVEFP